MPKAALLGVFFIYRVFQLFAVYHRETHRKHQKFAVSNKNTEERTEHRGQSTFQVVESCAGRPKKNLKPGRDK
jgi:hypothetical protein